MRSGKKPEEFLKYLIEMATKPDDLVMDFFLGTGGTIAAAMKLNRRFIGIEQMDYGSDDSIVRLRNVVQGDQTGISKIVNWEGGGSFVYSELAKANQKYADLILVAKSSTELEQIYEEMKDKAFLSYKVEPKTIDGISLEFAELSFENQKKLLIELLDKNMLYVPLSEIDDVTYGLSDTDKNFNKQIFG